MVGLFFGLLSAALPSVDYHMVCIRTASIIVSLRTATVIASLEVMTQVQMFTLFFYGDLVLLMACFMR